MVRRIAAIARTLFLMLLVGSTSTAAWAQCTFNSASGSPNPVTVGSPINFTWSAPTGTCPGGQPAQFVGYRFYVQVPGGSFVKANPDPGTQRSYSYTPTVTGTHNFQARAVYSTDPACATCEVGEVSSNTVSINVQGCTYGVSPTSTSAPQSGGSGTINVTAASGCTWTAVSNSSFITITSGASGSGNGTVSYSVSANPGASRSGSLTVANQTVTLTQAGTPCSYNLAPASADIGTSGGGGTFMVMAPPGCTWSAVSTVPFIAVTGGSSGSGNGLVSYNVLGNPGSARSGAIIVVSATFTIRQTGATAARRRAVRHRSANAGFPATSGLCSAASVPIRTEGVATPCAGDEHHLCLAGGRFEVAARAFDPISGVVRPGRAVMIGDTLARFLFDPLVDGDASVGADVMLTGGENPLLLYSGDAALQYTISITDTATGRVSEYPKPQHSDCVEFDPNPF